MKPALNPPYSLATLTRHARWLNAQTQLKRKLPPLFFLTDFTRTPNPLDTLTHLPPGTGVIFRHYESSHRLALARVLKACCQKRRLVFLVAGDAVLASRVRADGLHMPEYQIDRLKTWRRARPDWILTASIHSRAGLIRAAKAGAHATFASPVFATKSHPKARPLGIVRLAALCRDTPLPVYALGGINAANIARLTGAGAVGIGAIEALL